MNLRGVFLLNCHSCGVSPDVDADVLTGCVGDWSENASDEGSRIAVESRCGAVMHDINETDLQRLALA